MYLSHLIVVYKTRHGFIRITVGDPVFGRVDLRFYDRSNPISRFAFTSIRTISRAPVVVITFCLFLLGQLLFIPGRG